LGGRQRPAREPSLLPTTSLQAAHEGRQPPADSHAPLIVEFPRRAEPQELPSPPDEPLVVPEEPLPSPSEVCRVEPAPEGPHDLGVSLPERSRQLEWIAREADAHTQRGFELAGRKALFSARSEFVKALRLIAGGVDTEYETRGHSRALASGLTALHEADDFVPAGSQLEADLDLARIVAAHRTPILQGVPAEQLSPMSALQSYLTYAQEQLALSASNEAAGSMALYGLGNLHRALGRQSAAAVRVAQAKAVVFYQAALLVCPRNYMASNELGVVLAHGGRYEEARTALEHSIAVCPQAISWHNLAVVYRNLGLIDAARRADKLSRASHPGATVPAASDRPQVEWMDSATFARRSGLPASPESAAPNRAAPPRVANSPSWNSTDTRN
jgi:tetratricopeptide (TPR) repeat protein